MKPDANLAAMFAALREDLLLLHAGMAEDEQLFLDTLEGQTDAFDILRSITRHVILSEIYAEALAGRIRALQERKERFETTAEHCRAALADGMVALAIKQVPAEDFTLSLTDARRKVIVSDMEKLPEAFIRTKREPKLRDLYAAMEAGQCFEGASFNNPGKTVTIRKA